MSARRKPTYWALRLERWGAWRVGAGGAKVATWARMRAGDSPLGNWAASDEGVPRLYLEERETHEFIGLLAHRPDTAELARFAVAAYPHSARLAQTLGLAASSLAERHKRLYRTLARLLDQRKKGEPLDPVRRPPRVKRTSTRLARTRVAAVLVDET
ncbi:MAG: hypothetical protein LW854_21305 [Rubrivivax sp.]|jgi:hypothetical protein|nr:hypothetical protein [Rubrivivax sp.]